MNCRDFTKEEIELGNKLYRDLYPNSRSLHTRLPYDMINFFEVARKILRGEYRVGN